MMSLRTPNMRRLRTVLTSLFLSYTCFGFVLGHCLLRRLLGFSNYWTAALIPGFISCLLSIFLERSSRRTALATYVCTVASESVFNSLKEKGLVSGLRHGNDDGTENIISSTSQARFFSSPALPPPSSSCSKEATEGRRLITRY